MDIPRRPLGKSGIPVSIVSLGCWQFGITGWAGTDDQASIETVQAALDAGVNLIDTAKGYGRGHSEEIVGKAIRGRREQAVVASKCGALPEQIYKDIDQCLSRMGLDYVDLYQVHYPSPHVPVPDTIGAMLEIKKQGKIRAIGVSNFNLQQMRQAVATGQIDSCQPPLNILWQQYVDDVIPFCAEHDIAVLAYSPLAQGLLTGKYGPDNRPDDDVRRANLLFQEGTYEKALGVVDAMRRIADAHGVTVTQVAVNWTAYFPGVTSVICGARRKEHILGAAGGVGWRMSDEEHARLTEMGRRISDTLDFSANMWGWSPEKADWAGR